MKNSGDENPTVVNQIEDDMTALLDATQAWVNRFAKAPEIGQANDADKTFDELLKIKLGLFCTPPIHRIVRYICQVAFSQG